MIPQQKLLKILKLITLLKSGSGATISFLSKSLDLSERTIYRYIIILEEVGFYIDKNFNNKYFIHQNADDPSDLAFTTEELALIRQTIESTAYRHPLKEAIVKKLYIHSELEPIAENLFKARLGLLVEKLKAGIQNEVQVILKSYHSANSGEISDRLVEPLIFSENYTQIKAYEPKSKQLKIFKLERISDIILLAKPQKFKNTNPEEPEDLFGITGFKLEEVVLKLSLRAYLLMREEFPRSIPFLKEENQEYFFIGTVNGFSGISRFILGLLDEVEICKPDALKEHIFQKINQHTLGINTGIYPGFSEAKKE